MLLIVTLFAVGAVAGFIDAIAGGGGLLTLPALLLTGVPPQVALGTNKGQSVFGSGTALSQFWGSHLFDRRRALISIPVALIGAAVGVVLVSQIDPQILAPLVMVLLGAAAVVTLIQRPPARPLPRRDRGLLLAALVAGLIAAYDGFFGPGTGTFLILAYAYLWRDPLDCASANAKAVNFASNLASLAIFWVQDLIMWKLALPMALGQIIGGYCGAHTTIRGGKSVVRWFVVIVSAALVARLAWQLWSDQPGAANPIESELLGGAAVENFPLAASPFILHDVLKLQPSRLRLAAANRILTGQHFLRKQLLLARLRFCCFVFHHDKL